MIRRYLGSNGKWVLGIRGGLGELEAASMHVWYCFHSREIVREFPMPEKVPRTDQDKTHKVTAGARIGRQPDILRVDSIIGIVRETWFGLQ